jgi:hypothetical protein
VVKIQCAYDLHFKEKTLMGISDADKVDATVEAGEKRIIETKHRKSGQVLSGFIRLP